MPKVLIVLIPLLLVLLVAMLVLAGLSRDRGRLQRTKFIAGYRFPAALVRHYGETHPQLGLLEVRKVFEGLRQYFLACLAAQRGSIAPSVGMPSKAVDEAWHDFILMTRDYQAFCRQAFGKYLHHTPERVMGTPMRDALANTLHQFERPLPGGVAWATAGAIPLLFAMDRELGLADGYHHDAQSLLELEGARQSLARDRAHKNSAGGGGCGGSIGCDAGGGSCCGGGCSGGGGCGSS